MRLNGVNKTMIRKEALRLHREMWADMQKELGDCPTTAGRLVFKREWVKRHGYADVMCNCFLCEYVRDWSHSCSSCPIDWSSLSANGISFCTSSYQRANDSIHGNAPISEILALPERSE